MRIQYKKIIYRVTIERGDEKFINHNMDNCEYCRINDEWHVNTGGSVLEWRQVSNEEAILLEEEFYKIIDNYIE